MVARRRRRGNAPISGRSLYSRARRRRRLLRARNCRRVANADRRQTAARCFFNNMRAKSFFSRLFYGYTRRFSIMRQVGRLRSRIKGDSTCARARFLPIRSSLRTSNSCGLQTC